MAQRHHYLLRLLVECTRVARVVDQPGVAQGSARVDRHPRQPGREQTTVGDRRSQLPRRHRADDAEAAPGRRSTPAEHLHRVREPRSDGSATGRPADPARTSKAVNSDRTVSALPRERAQPAAHRRHRPAQPRRDRPMPRTGRLHPQRRTDHLDAVGPAQQARHRQQHMRHPTACHSGPAAAEAPRPRGPSALAGMTPRGKTTAARAQQLTSPSRRSTSTEIAYLP